MGFEAPSLQDVNIYLNDQTPTLPPIPHLCQVINDVQEHYHATQIVLERDHFNFSLLTRSEGVGHNPPHFRLRSSSFLNLNVQNWIMELTSISSAKLPTMEELHIIFRREMDAEEEVIPCSARSPTLQRFFTTNRVNQAGVKITTC